MKLQELIDKRRKSISFKSRMNLTIDIALYHEEENDFKEAFEEYKTLLSLSLEDKDLVMQAKAYRQMGECMLELQSPIKALEHIKMYLKTAKSSGDLFEIQRAYVTIGRCYLDLALKSKFPKYKHTLFSQSESSFLRSLQLTHKLSQTTLSGSSQSDSKIDGELTEMRAVSMFNLGLVNRERDTESSLTAAEKYLSQCSSLSLNRKFNDLYLRAIMETMDLKYNRGLRHIVSDVDQKKAQSYLDDALKLMKSSFKHLSNVPFTSNMKKLRKDIQVLEARLLLVGGHVLKAAKKYRNLRSKFQSNRELFNEKLILCIRLNKKLCNAFNKNGSTKDNKFLGQLYEELEVPQIAHKYYQKAMESIKDKKHKDFWKFLNKLITINTICKYYKDNILLLEMKLQHILLEQSKDGFNSRLSSRHGCSVILQIVDCWIKSGTLLSEDKDKIDAYIEQMNGLSILSESSYAETKSTKAAIAVYEQLSSQDVDSYKDKLREAKEKLLHLKLLSNSTENYEDDISEDDNFDCLSSSDEMNESALSSLESFNSEFDVDNLSSDSDGDYNILSTSQIEELEAVGKRVASNKNKTFIKKNEKGESMLHVAAIKGCVKQVEHLLNQMKHPVDIRDTAGWTPLHDAANHGHIKVVEVLLDHGANMEHTGPAVDRSTPLMEAVNGGSIDTALLLIERGANLWHKNALGENVGDCVDMWRQRCKDNDAYSEPEARAYKILHMNIRNRLGSRYVEWCRERKGMSSYVSKPQTIMKTFSKVKDCRRTIESGEESEDKISEDEDNPVQNYCNTITNLGSRIISKEVHKEDKLTTKEGAGYVVGDDWLENDMQKVKKSCVTEPDYGSFTRTRPSTKQKSVEGRNGNIKRSLKRITFDNDNEIITESYTSAGVNNPKKRKVFRNENIKPSIKMITPDPENSSFRQLSEDEDLFPTQNSDDSSNFTPTTVTVTFRTISMVVPVTENCSVQWLLDEVVHRYSFLIPNDPIRKSSSLRISREDGAVLMPSDGLLSALSDTTSGVIRLYVTEGLSQLCPELINDAESLVPDHYISLVSSIKSSLLLGVLDLSGRNLSTNLLEFLACLIFTQNIPPLKRINFNGNNITDSILNKTFKNNHGDVSLANFISNHSSTLEELDLSGNEISGNCFSDFLHVMRSKGLSNLKVLNLSNNLLGLNDFCVVTLVMKPIIMICPLIDQLILSDCKISNFSELTHSLNYTHDSLSLQSNLSFLDLSYNPFILRRDCVDLIFWKYVKNSLKHLSVRGCGSLVPTFENISMSSPNNVLMEMMATIVDLINNNLCRVHTLDIGNCGQDSESLCHLNRFFTNKNCSLTTLICDDNVCLSQSISCWSGLVHNLSQSLCTITHLVIDIPTIRSYDDYLTVLDSIQRKIQMRIGRPLTTLDLITDHNTMDFIKDAVLNHENEKVTDENIQKINDEPDGDNQLLQYSVCFVLSVLDLLRERYKKENVRVLYEGCTVKVMLLK